MDYKSLKSRFQGTLIGAAVGDALGNPVEGFSKESIAKKYGCLEDFAENWDPAGTYTDDSELTIATVESLVDIRGFSIDDLARRFKSWLKNPNSFGIATQSACVNLINGKSPDKSGINSPGNGAAMRASPFGLLYSHPEDIDLLKKCTEKAARMTHNNKDAVAGAIAVAYSIAYILNRHDSFSPEYFISAVADVTKKYSGELAKKILSLKKYLPDKNADEKLGTGGYVLESVPFAMYCFLASPHDYSEAVLRAVNAGGDTDTNASIAGAMAGAMNGISSIPEKWIDGLKTNKKNGPFLKKLASKLHKLFVFNLPD